MSSGCCPVSSLGFKGFLSCFEVVSGRGLDGLGRLRLPSPIHPFLQHPRGFDKDVGIKDVGFGRFNEGLFRSLQGFRICLKVAGTKMYQASSLIRTSESL